MRDALPDPAVIADPPHFDITRADAGKPPAFSYALDLLRWSASTSAAGPALAKMEGEVGLRAVFDRFLDLGLALTLPPHRRPSPIPARSTATNRNPERFG